jgi:hypothetical protein
MTYEDLIALSDARHGQVRPPDNATLTYSICGPDADACGWEGWLLEDASINTVATNGNRQKGHLPAVTLQICPNCRKTLFRTDSRFELQCSGATPPFTGHTAPIRTRKPRSPRSPA